MSKHVNLYWEDVKSLTHTKHHIILTSGTASSIRKRRLCVGTSRIRDTFQLLTSHQKMALELRDRKLLIRSECSSTSTTRLPKATSLNKSLVTRPTSFIEPAKSPVNEVIKSISSATLPRPSNAVRIYVPFGDVIKKTRTKSVDVTTRVIDVKSNSPLPELVHVTSAAESSTYSTLSWPDSVVPTSPRKSTLVRMGTKISSDALIREKMRLQDVSFTERVASADPSGAYVVGKLDPVTPLSPLTNNTLQRYYISSYLIVSFYLFFSKFLFVFIKLDLFFSFLFLVR